MANHEACELFIEQQIEEGLEDGKSPYAIGKELSVWIARLFEVKIPRRTIETRAARQQKKITSNEANQENPIESGTTDELEKLEKTWGGARPGSGRKPMKEPVTFDAADEDDLKVVGEVIAEKIRSGEAGVRVGKIVASAVKQTMKEMGPPPEPKPVNNFDRLWKHGLSFVEGITFWADGTMVPTTEDERIAAAGIRACIPSIIIYAARLGIDVNAVLKLGCNAAHVAPGHMIEGRKEEEHPVIDV